MMKAAIENGADAVYFGLQEYNARIRAANFSTADLPEIMSWLHTRGVRGYVTLNTLVFSSELEGIARVVQQCSAAGVDAVLVQDLGLAWLCNQIAPDLPVHASTQMTMTCAETIAGAEALGLNLERVVAARETSLKELKTLRRGTAKEIEVFVHGAICVAYSGQCLTSEALGGRSANRGECAQACRLPYDLYVDDEKHDLGDLRYLLSPKDLSAYEDIGELIRSGIVSLKIEGRLKSPQYVAATVQAYRKAVDDAFGSKETMIVEADAVADPRLNRETSEMLEMTFSRGFTGGYLHKTDHQAVVEGRFPKKRGLFLGTVVGLADGAAGKNHRGGKFVQKQRRPDGVVIALEGPLKPGDGLVFDAGRPDGDEQGGRVYEIEAVSRESQHTSNADSRRNQARSGKTAVVRFGRDAINFSRINIGDRVWKTSDPAMDRRLLDSFSGDTLRFRRAVTAEVNLAAGKPMRLTLRYCQGEAVTVEDSAPGEIAQMRPLTKEFLEDQIGRLGGTPFFLERLDAEIAGDIMIPVSRINQLRRDAVDQLLEALARRGTSRTAIPAVTVRDILDSAVERNTSFNPPPSTTLSVLCRTLEQVEAAAGMSDIATIYTDFEDIRLHREARNLVPSKVNGHGPAFMPATLRIIKPGEATFARKLLEAQPDGILVRNLAAWHLLRHEHGPDGNPLPLVADYSLNVSNHVTARLLMGHGFHRLTPSYDLNIDQLCDMLGHAGPGWFEVTVHQHLPMFHMEHCVFCRFLSEGTDFTNCGRPCETHEIELRDRMGYKHPVKADAGCRNTVFNAIPQSAGAYLERLRSSGVGHYRIELLAEDAAKTRTTIEAYLAAIRGQTGPRELWSEVKAISKLGVTRGSLDT